MAVQIAYLKCLKTEKHLTFANIFFCNLNGVKVGHAALSGPADIFIWLQVVDKVGKLALVVIHTEALFQSQLLNRVRLTDSLADVESLDLVVGADLVAMQLKDDRRGKWRVLVQLLAQRKQKGGNFVVVLREKPNYNLQISKHSILYRSVDVGSSQ